MKTTSISPNPEINTSTRKGNDAKWDERIKKYEAKRAGEKNAPGAPNPTSSYSDEKGQSTVSLMKMLKEFGGLSGLTGRSLGFSADEHKNFQPELAFVTAPEDNDGKLSPQDIQQAIADCYWVASLMSILEEHPTFLDDAVRPIEKGTRSDLDPKLEWYEVDVYPKGLFGFHKETVVVSNALPSNHLKSADERVTPDELKAMLYEKAFAMWQGGYSEHTWGFTGRAMANMTGNSASYAVVPGKSEESVWNTLNKKKGKHHALVAIVMNHHDYVANLKFLPESIREKQSKLAEERNPSSVGLVNKHCYSVVRTAEEKIEVAVEKNGKRTFEEQLTKVVYLRNPRSPAKPIRVTLSDFCKTVMMMVSAKVDAPVEVPAAPATPVVTTPAPTAPSAPSAPAATAANAAPATVPAAATITAL